MAKMSQEHAALLLPLSKIKITFQPEPQQYSRALKKITKEAFRKIGEHWIANYLAKHFQSGNTQRYRLQARKEKYRRVKRKYAQTSGKTKVLKGGFVALVYTGAAEWMATHTARVKAFPTRGYVLMSVPRYVTINPISGRPNLYQEIARRIPSENREAARIAQESTVADLKNMRGGSKYTVTIQA